MRPISLKESIVVKKNILLGEFLVEQGFITPEQLQEALKYHHDHGTRLGQSLIELGYITESEMIKALSEQLGVQYVKLRTYRIDPEVLKLVSTEMAWNFHVIPLFKIRERLTVAMINPLDIFAIDALTRATRMKIEPVVCSESELREALETYYPQGGTSQPAPPSEGNGYPRAEPEPKAPPPAFLQELEEFLGNLAQKQARQAFISGNKIRVDFGAGHEDWPVPDRINKKTFIRMLCNLGEEALPNERDPHRFVIQKQWQGQALRFHVITGSGFSTETATVIVQMPRELTNGFPNGRSKIHHLSAALPKTRGIVLLVAPALHTLDQIYYPLWQSLNGDLNYPISIETQPTTLLPETTQLASTHPSQQIGMLRYAQAVNSDCVFLKNVVDPNVIGQAASLAEMGVTVVLGVVSRRPWGVAASLIENSQNPFFQQQLRKVYLYYPVPQLCPHCRQSAELSKELQQAMGARADFQPYLPGKCDQCNRTGYAGHIDLELCWEEIASKDHENGALREVKLEQKFRRDLRKKVLTLLQKGQVSYKDVEDIFVA